MSTQEVMTRQMISETVGATDPISKTRRERRILIFVSKLFICGIANCWSVFILYRIVRLAMYLYSKMTISSLDFSISEVLLDYVGLEHSNTETVDLSEFLTIEFMSRLVLHFLCLWYISYYTSSVARLVKPKWRVALMVFTVVLLCLMVYNLFKLEFARSLTDKIQLYVGLCYEIVGNGNVFTTVLCAIFLGTLLMMSTLALSAGTNLASITPFEFSRKHFPISIKLLAVDARPGRMPILDINFTSVSGRKYSVVISGRDDFGKMPELSTNVFTRHKQMLLTHVNYDLPRPTSQVNVTPVSTPDIVIQSPVSAGPDFEVYEDQWSDAGYEPYISNQYFLSQAEERYSVEYGQPHPVSLQHDVEAYQAAVPIPRQPSLPVQRVNDFVNWDVFSSCAGAQLGVENYELPFGLRRRHVNRVASVDSRHDAIPLHDIGRRSDWDTGCATSV
ncbi:hypothetical protein V1512DRAFT_27611 [Lipomyces arxii]|uniref:uncharacterized protein n=1 Tax=Lipomyces arxii TaxID=56418 RepID=UPI0034CE5FAE